MWLLFAATRARILVAKKDRPGAPAPLHLAVVVAECRQPARVALGSPRLTAPLEGAGQGTARGTVRPAAHAASTPRHTRPARPALPSLRRLWPCVYKRS